MRDRCSCCPSRKEVLFDIVQRALYAVIDIEKRTSSGLAHVEENFRRCADETRALRLDMEHREQTGEW